MSENYEFYTAGVKFHELYKCIKEINEGDELNLVPEPTNKYDPNAVRIEFASSKGDIMVGYVPAKISASISALIVTGSPKCTVLKVNPDAKTWQQLKVEIKES